MKKTSSFLFLLIFAAFNCHSQNNGYISFSYGIAIPTGDLGSLAVNSSRAGIAKNGGVFEIAFASKLGSNFGLSAMILGQTNSIDNQAILDYLHTKNPDVNWTTDTKPWSSGGALVGIYGTFPLNKDKLSLEFKGLIGFLHCSSPSITIIGKLGSTSLWDNLSSGTANSISYSIGTGLKYNISKEICLLTNIDYLNASLEFQNVQIVSNFGYSVKGKLEQDYSTFGIVVGIGIRI